MKAIGIIAEYNPFTNGHKYHIDKIKEKYPDYTLIAIMTGNFTQRGEPAVIDKWKRCEIALNLGVDLVIELPYPFATEGADVFAYGAVTLLEHLQVEKIIFGSESDNIEDLELIAKTQVDNEDFDKLVKIYSKFGNNYPTALSNALFDLTNKKITTPNDLLGISYIKEIYKNNYKLKYETIKRTNNYHEKDILSSATSIRESLKNNNDLNNIKDYIPSIELNYLNNLHFPDNYFSILKYKIITEKDLSLYQTVDEGIDNTLKKVINQSNNYNELINNIKSKRYTYNKINRLLNHILCNFTKDLKNEMTKITYIRILGLNNNGRKYLNGIKNNLDIPLISKIERNKDKMLEFEIETTKIYDIIHNENLTEREFKRIIYKGEENDKK